MSNYLHCKITLSSGRSIFLEKLYQQQTYAGFIEGFPNKTNNNRQIEFVVEIARKMDDNESDVHLVSPERYSYLRQMGGKEKDFFNDKSTEWLPMVACVGIFKSDAIARNPKKQESRLTLVWYQDEFGPPIDEGVLERIKAIDWNSLAVDIDEY